MVALELLAPTKNRQIACASAVEDKRKPISPCTSQLALPKAMIQSDPAPKSPPLAAPLCCLLHKVHRHALHEHEHYMKHLESIHSVAMLHWCDFLRPTLVTVL